MLKYVTVDIGGTCEKEYKYTLSLFLNSVYNLGYITERYRCRMFF